MKATRRPLVVTVTMLLLCGAAFAQLPQSSPIGMTDTPLRRAMHLSRPGATYAYDAEAETQPEAPALSLTWGIYTYPGSVGGWVAGVNKAGHIVGGYGPNAGPVHGFLLKSNKFTSFDYPGAASTVPGGINDASEIVGSWFDSSGYEHSFQLKGGTFTTIDPPGSNASFALGINNAGDIVGSWSADDFQNTCHGYLYSKGVFTNIDYPGDFCTYVNGINNAGEMAGWYYLTSPTSGNGFVYSKGTFTTVNYPGSYDYNGVIDINDDGLILGAYGDTGYPYVFQHCYLYQSGTYTSCDPPFGPPAWIAPSHLNDLGIVAGNYVDNSGTGYGYTAVVGP